MKRRFVSGTGYCIGEDAMNDDDCGYGESDA